MKDFLVCLALSFSATGVGGLAGAQSGAFYTRLTRPAWAPPASIFGPVWTVLYIMIAMAAWLAWTASNLSLSFILLTLYRKRLMMYP